MASSSLIRSSTPAIDVSPPASLFRHAGQSKVCYFASLIAQINVVKNGLYISDFSILLFILFCCFWFLILKIRWDFGFLITRDEFDSEGDLVFFRLVLREQMNRENPGKMVQSSWIVSLVGIGIKCFMFYVPPFFWEIEMIKSSLVARISEAFDLVSPS